MRVACLPPRHATTTGSPPPAARARCCDCSSGTARLVMRPDQAMPAHSSVTPATSSTWPRPVPVNTPGVRTHCLAQRQTNRRQQRQRQCAQPRARHPGQDLAGEACALFQVAADRVEYVGQREAVSLRELPRLRRPGRARWPAPGFAPGARRLTCHRPGEPPRRWLAWCRRSVEVRLLRPAQRRSPGARRNVGPRRAVRSASARPSTAVRVWRLSVRARSWRRAVIASKVAASAPPSPATSQPGYDRGGHRRDRTRTWCAQTLAGPLTCDGT